MLISVASMIIISQQHFLYNPAMFCMKVTIGRQCLNKTFPYFPCDYLIRAKIRENTYHFTNELAGKPVK
jgi:hypothetical protein